MTRRFLILITQAIVLCGVSERASRCESVRPFHFQVETKEFANAAYNVGCLTNRLPCSKSEFEKFWQLTPADQVLLDTWNKILDAIAARQPKPPDSPFLPNYSAYFPEATAINQVLSAALGARSPDDFRKRAVSLAPEPEIAQLATVLRHVERRLHPWWKSKGERYLAARRRIVQSVMDAPEVPALVGRIARFTESDISDHQFQVHLIPRQDPRSDAATATVIGNHVLFELTDQAKPKELLPLVMHELTHAFYDRAPMHLHQKLIQEFVASSVPQSQSLYSILNEGIATAVQLSLIPQTGPDEDQDEYRDPFIPRIGRAVAPHMKQALEKGPTLFHGFLDTYISASLAELKEELASPRFTLITDMRLPIGDLPNAEAACQTNLATHWYASFNERNRYPELNLLILVTYDKLDVIEGNWDQLVPLSKAHRGFALTDKRNNKGRTYVLAGRDDATVAELVKRLSKIRTGGPDGLLLTVD